MNLKAMMNTVTTQCRTLPVVILYVTEGCNLRCLTCSYRNPLPGELSLPEIRDLADSLGRFGLRHIVYSGGEPLMRRDFPEICEIFAGQGVQQTLLTNGLLLKKRWDQIRGLLSEIIVSLDGPEAEIHDGIRGVESFDRILEGIAGAREGAPLNDLAIRMVIQKRNFRFIAGMVRLALRFHVSRVSFLAADVHSESFGRAANGPAAPISEIALSPGETEEFREIVEAMRPEFREQFQSGFISESPERLLHIAQYYEAIAGRAPFPDNRCNAPMVSAVISSTGDVHPCFFLPSFSNIRSGSLEALLNTPEILSTRSDVRGMKLQRCTTCVCTLYVSPFKAFQGIF